MGEKVTRMVLKVDLQCPCCYKKIKKLLCKFPQIRDQVYDEKQNTVTISVVCCSPEKIRDKLCCKGGKTIQSIEIVKPKPPPPPEAKPPDKKIPIKPPETKPPPEKAKPPPPPAPGAKPPDKKILIKPPETKPPPEKAKPPPEAKPPEKTNPPPEKTKPPANPPPVIVQYGYPPPYPGMGCCGPCSEGYPGGPCYHGFGRPAPPPPQPCYDGYGYEYGYSYGYGGNRPHMSRCGNYFSEENPSGCSIM